MTHDITLKTNHPSMLDSFVDSPFAQTPSVIRSMVLNYVPAQEVGKNVHLVNSKCRYLWGNSNHLNLSNTKITDFDLFRIIQIYKKNAKITSIDLSNCQYITDKSLAFLACLPIKQLNVSYCRQLTIQGFKFLATLPLTLIRAISARF